MKGLAKRRSIRLSRDAYDTNNAFFITIVTHRRYPWFQVHQELAKETVHEIRRLADQRRTTIFAWCLMPDHLHILLQDRYLIDFVRLLKGRLSVFGRHMEPGRRLWQRSFYDHGLRQAEVVSDVCVYIWNNPVRKGLVKTAGEYPWSGGERFKEVCGRG
jgi:REP element-mobilizing transposase RayT